MHYYNEQLLYVGFGGTKFGENCGKKGEISPVGGDGLHGPRVSGNELGEEEGIAPFGVCDLQEPERGGFGGERKKDCVEKKDNMPTGDENVESLKLVEDNLDGATEMEDSNRRPVRSFDLD